MATLWQPPGIVRSAVSTQTAVTALMNARAAMPAQYVETLHVTGPDGFFDATARVRGTDYRIDVLLNGASYAFGRFGTRSWRRTPNGSVRIIGADVQSDPLDRWPRILFGFAPAGCTAAGTTQLGDKALWVLSCSAPGDIAHWYDLDPATGRVARETARDGTHVFTYDFADATHWTIGGYGGDAHVAVTSMHAQPVDLDAVTIPIPVRDQFELPASGIAEIPASFQFHIETKVRIDGVLKKFDIDTGTTQILIDIGEAARLGLHPAFGHVIIPELRVGDAVARNLAAQAVDFFHDTDGAGLLGNEFFTGHIVHIDYKNERVELISHQAFTPPPGAHPIALDPREGMPLVQAGAGSVTGARFALDTGSYWIMLSPAFAQLIGAQKAPDVGYPAENMNFLEGPVFAQLRDIASFQMEGERFSNVDAEVEIPATYDLDIPLDGIIGQNVLSAFEWWYDYDDGVAWIRR